MTFINKRLNKGLKQFSLRFKDNKINYNGLGMVRFLTLKNIEL